MTPLYFREFLSTSLFLSHTHSGGLYSESQNKAVQRLALSPHGGKVKDFPTVWSLEGMHTKLMSSLHMSVCHWDKLVTCPEWMRLRENDRNVMQPKEKM